MATNQKRYLWCERTEAEYVKIRAEIEKRRVEMLDLEQHAKLDWPARHRELEDWLERGREFIDKYALGIDESWEAVCDCAQHGWDDLKSEVHSILDESKP
jgi:hypothetical protein